MKFKDRLVSVDDSYQTLVDPNEVIGVEEQDDICFHTNIYLRGGVTIRVMLRPAEVIQRLNKG